MLTFGSLFAGIGGLDLGLERAGLRCAWQVEIDQFCRKVLARHWPDVRRWTDVRTLFTTSAQSIEDWKVDLICGGFPCQDISEANAHGKGLDGEQSGLWREFARVLRVLRPRYAVIENVAALAFRGLGRVLCDLADIGFDAEWSVVSACSLGAPHTRDRLFIVAYSQEDQRGAVCPEGRSLDERGDLLHGGRGEDASWGGIPHALCAQPWTVEPRLYGVAHGVPDRVDRINGVGNAVVPAVAEYIGRRIVTIHEREK